MKHSILAWMGPVAVTLSIVMLCTVSFAAPGQRGGQQGQGQGARRGPPPPMGAGQQNGQGRQQQGGNQQGGGQQGGQQQGGQGMNPEMMIMMMIQNFDQDGDQALNAEELMQAMRALHERMQQQQRGGNQQGGGQQGGQQQMRQGPPGGQQQGQAQGARRGPPPQGGQGQGRRGR